MSAEYSGKICIVTGAVSRIGRALCGELLRQGAVVYMGDVSDAALNQMANEFNLSYPGRAFSVPTDVTQPLDAQHLVDVALSRKGRLDCLMMAEVAPCSVPIGQVMAESWRYAIDVNLMGVVHMVEAVLPTMREHGHGRIALLLPLSGVLPAPFEAVCSATHAAARALMESLRYELWDEKIQCTSACLDGCLSGVRAGRGRARGGRGGLRCWRASPPTSRWSSGRRTRGCRSKPAARPPTRASSA